VEFIDLGDGRFGLIPATEEISTLKGSVHRPARPVGVAAMNRAIRKRAAAR
jgi:hypothetical protein